MHHFSEMTDQGQYRQRRLDHHAIVLFATLAQPQVVGMPVHLGETLGVLLSALALILKIGELADFSN